MMLAEFGSTEAEEMSVFHKLLEGKGTNPPRLAPCPVDICEHDDVCVEPFTWKFSGEEVEEPGSGFSTDSANVPAVVALPVAVSCAEETNVVESGALLRRACAPEMKLEPVMVRVKVPRFVDVGEIPVSVGVGFQSVTAEEADLLESADDVAVTVTVFGEGRVAGAT